MSVYLIFFHQSCHITKLFASFLSSAENRSWLTCYEPRKGRTPYCGSNRADLYDRADLYGRADLYDRADLYGRAGLYDKADFYEKAGLYGKTNLYGETGYEGTWAIYIKTRNLLWTSCSIQIIRSQLFLQIYFKQAIKYNYLFFTFRSTVFRNSFRHFNR